MPPDIGFDGSVFCKESFHGASGLGSCRAGAGDAESRSQRAASTCQCVYLVIGRRTCGVRQFRRCCALYCTEGVEPAEKPACPDVLGPEEPLGLVMLELEVSLRPGSVELDPLCPELVERE